MSIIWILGAPLFSRRLFIDSIICSLLRFIVSLKSKAGLFIAPRPSVSLDDAKRRGEEVEFFAQAVL